uniref:Uncharacterized protein n=1 Tax=Oreochromis niloticus TaxID=8128 RepID=A0A669C9F6_ORENI
LKKHTMGIYVINKEDGQNGNYDDIGIFVEGEIVMDNIGSPAQCALMLGVIYALNLAYSKELRHYYEFIQKVLMGLDGEKLSPKVLGLKLWLVCGCSMFYSFLEEEKHWLTFLLSVVSFLFE